MQNLAQAIDLINLYKGDFEGKKSDIIIEKAENKLGIVFPPSYRHFLKTLGCGGIQGIEFFGIINEDFENSGIPDAIWLTINERKLGLPKKLILIGYTGYGTYYALDTSQPNSEGEYPVVEYSPNIEPVIVADNYGTFLLNELKTILE